MNESEPSERIEGFLEGIMAVARGDLNVQLKVTEKNDYLDALALGINMMIDDIKKNRDIALENKKIKLLNAQLEVARQKAEESERLKMAFLSNMSHEIRTPMNGIIGFTRILREKELSAINQQKYLSIIEKSGMRLLELINNLIDISKIEAGLMKIYLSDMNVGEMMDFIFNFFKPEADSKTLNLSTHVPPEVKALVISTDQEKVYAILTNLIKNAVKYTNKGSIEIGCNLDSDKLTFYVKDTGMGIPDDSQKSIFDRFVQSKNAINKASEGAGLGLAIAKNYVEMLGGKIWLESKEDVGSTFYFTIPLVNAQKQV